MAVLSDLLENFFTGLVAWCLAHGNTVWAAVFASPMTVFSVAKWACLVGVLALIAFPARNRGGGSASMKRAT
jgi:hypothetical protein